MLSPLQTDALALLLRGPLSSAALSDRLCRSYGDTHGALCRLPDLVQLDGGEWHVRGRAVVAALVNAARRAHAFQAADAAKAAIRRSLVACGAVGLAGCSTEGNAHWAALPFLFVAVVSLLAFVAGRD